MKHKATPEQQAKAKERRAAFATLCKLVADMAPDQKAKYNNRAPVMTADNGTTETQVMDFARNAPNGSPRAKRPKPCKRIMAPRK